MIDFSSTYHCHKKFLLIIVFLTIAALFYWYLPNIYEDKDSSFVTPFTIIALGDSLTEGFIRHDSSGHRLVTKSFHPYTLQLEKRLPIGKKIKVINSGISGERVQSMKNRLEDILKGSNMKNGIIIILGGTNDCLDMIRQGKSNNTLDVEIKKTVETIIEMHRLCQKNNLHSVVMTIPPITRGGWSEIFNSIRGNINRELRNFSLKNKQSFKFADIGNFVDNLLNDKLFWDDGLHFTSHGYDKMGDFIFEEIKNLI